MEITNAVKGRTMKSATVTGTDDLDAATDAVMAHFGETKGSLFGWTADRYSTGEIRVELWTD